MGAVKPMLLIGAGVVCLGNLLHIIGLGTPNWVTGEVLGIDSNVGLFRGCLNDNCDDIEDPSSDLEAVQAMTILGMLCGLLGAVLAIVMFIFGLLSKTLPRILAIICAGACIAAGVLIIIGVIIYGAKVYDDMSSAYDLGFSFGLCIVGAILIPVGGILVFVGGKSDLDSGVDVA